MLKTFKDAADKELGLIACHTVSPRHACERRVDLGEGVSAAARIVLRELQEQRQTGGVMLVVAGKNGHEH